MRPTASERAQSILGRALTPAERDFLSEHFGGSLELTPIRIAASLGARSWSPYGPRISLVRRHFVDGSPASEVRLNSPVTASVLAHEALHVWQRQGGRRVTWEAIPLQARYILGRHDPYAYRITDDPAVMLTEFLTGNVEQQGKIFEDYVLRRCECSDASAYDLVAKYVRDRSG